MIQGLPPNQNTSPIKKLTENSNLSPSSLQYFQQQSPNHFYPQNPSRNFPMFFKSSSLGDNSPGKQPINSKDTLYSY